MNPLEAIENMGRRREWVAEQMGISPSYLSLLLTGKRRWTDDLQRRLALAVGIKRLALSFPGVSCDSESEEDHRTVTMAATPADSAPERVLAAITSSGASDAECDGTT